MFRIALLSVAVAVLLPACKRPSDLPDMGVSRTAVAFEAPSGSGEPAAQTVYVVNTGRGSLAAPTAEIAYQQGLGWLAVTVSGAAAPYGVLLAPTSAALAPGVYRATVTLACSNASASPAQVAVTLTVPDPRFTVSPGALAFEAPRGGADPAPKSFDVVNAGRGTLPVPHVDVDYVGTGGWLSTAVSGSSERYTVAVTPAVASLDSGQHVATLTISASGGAAPPRTLEVSLTVPEPEVALASTTVQFAGPTDGSDPAPVSIAVTNAGGGLLATPTATVSYPAGWQGPRWLSAAVSSAPEGHVVSLRAWQVRQDQRLDSGRQVATVSITSPDAANPPQELAVTLEVPAPIPAVSSSYVSGFSGYVGCPPSSEVTWVRVANAGAGNLARPTVRVPAELADWLDVTVTGDRAPYGLRFAARATPDTYRVGYVVVSSPGASTEPWVSVAFWPTAASGPLALSPLTSTLVIHAQAGAGDPAPQLIRSALGGGCPPATAVSIAYPADANPWLTAAPRTVTEGMWTYLDAVVVASTGGMEPGAVHTAEVTIAPEGAGSITVPVRLEVAGVSQGSSLAHARLSHTVTALADGGAVVVGGIYPTEVLERETGTWRVGGSLTHARNAHGAAAIGDYVVVCGGRSSGVDDLTCERSYRGNSWELLLARLQRPRSRPTVVPLRRGALLVVSHLQPPEIVPMGWGEASSTVVQGVSGFSAVRISETEVLVTAGRDATILDEIRDTWTPTGSLGTYREDPALALLQDGRVLAVGGRPNTQSAEIWDPRTGRWTPTAPPPSGHDQTDTLVLQNGKVATFAGGVASLAGYSADVELFDPVMERWTVAGRLDSARYGTTGARLADGRLILVGGYVLGYPGGETREVYWW